MFDYINLFCMGGLVGFFVGVFFFDLIIFELFYFLLILIMVNYYMVKNVVENNIGIEGVCMVDFSEDDVSNIQKVMV